VNHYCTYFDRNFLIQGLALARSLHAHDQDALLWVLCLDDFTHRYFTELSDQRIRPVPLATLEEADPALSAAKENRSLVEYYFTLSPCWPRFLLQTQPELERITYLDADLFFFARPQPIFAEMGGKSVFITEHRYPEHLSHHLRCGRFNVAILSFRNNPRGLRCLDRWREQCLDWCHDHVADGRYADQGYLNEWPSLFGDDLCISARSGVNLAPWNWAGHEIKVRNSSVQVDGLPLEIFHFARFRPTAGSFLFQSGQLEYGIMPWRMRQAIYGPYWRALEEARAAIRKDYPDFDFPKSRLRGWHSFWKAIGPRLLFGSDWWRIGQIFVSGRFGLGRYSGQLLGLARQQSHRNQTGSDAPQGLRDAVSSSPAADL
jgi:hypothetical protein